MSTFQFLDYNLCFCRFMRKFGSITLLERLGSIKSLYVLCITPGVKSRLYRD